MNIYVIAAIVIAIVIALIFTLSMLTAASNADDAAELAEHEAAVNARPLGNVELVPRSIEWDYPPRGGRP